MWGRGNKKKFKRQWLLDVRSRSGPLKAVRLRMAASALAISTSIVLVLFVSWKGGAYLLDQYIYTNPSFAIDRMPAGLIRDVIMTALSRTANASTAA